MSAFALPMPPPPLARELRRPTERSATTPEDRGQISDIGCGPGQTLQHAGDLPVLVLPALGDITIDIAKIASIKGPHLHLVGRARRHHQKAAELGLRPALPAEALGEVGTDGLGRSPDLVGQCPLFDAWKLKAHPMYFQRHPIGAPEHIEILKPPQSLHSDL